MKKQALRLPKQVPSRTFTRAMLAGRYVTLIAHEGERAQVQFPNGVRTWVEADLLSDVETFTIHGSAG